MQQGLQYKNTLFFTSKILVLRWAGILRFLIGEAGFLEEENNERGIYSFFYLKSLFQKQF